MPCRWYSDLAGIIWQVASLGALLGWGIKEWRAKGGSEEVKAGEKLGKHRGGMREKTSQQKEREGYANHTSNLIWPPLMVY